MNFTKNTSNNWVILFIVTIVIVVSTMSCVFTSAGSQNDDTQSINIASAKTCGAGWTIRLVDVEEELGSDGWKYVTAWIAFENNNAPIVERYKDLPGYDSPSWGGDKYLGMGTEFTAVSGEGYSYDARLDFDWTSGTLGNYWVPPGFRYRAIGGCGGRCGYPFIKFRAADTTSNYIIDTDCGALDLGQKNHLYFPVENTKGLSYLDIGTSVQLPEGDFRVVDVDADCEDAKRPNFESAVCIDIEFRNKNQGYEADPKIEVAVIGEAGILYDCGAYLVTGPGQTKVSTFDCATHTKHNRIAILSRADISEYWLLRIDN